MPYNLPPKVRFSLYVLTSLATIWLGFLADINAVNPSVLKAISATVAFVGVLAAYNVSNI